MKQLLLLCSLSLLLAACKKDNYSLPPETQTGAGTFGCKINGKVWVPKGSDGNNGQNITSHYQLLYAAPTGFYFNLSASKFNSTSLIETFVLGVDSLSLATGINVKLANSQKGITGGGRFYILSFSPTINYYTDDIYNGELKFTKFDESNRIASGTFWFDAYNADSGETIQVREGRFDVKFTR